MSMRKTLVYPILLGSFRGQLVIPADLQEDEAAQICAFVRALVVPWAKAQPAALKDSGS